MHGSISDEVVKNLNKLANNRSKRKFGEAFHNLSTNHKNEYIEHVKVRSSSTAMASILNALEKEEAILIFNQLLQENKKFAFNTLDCIHPQSNLFKTLLGALDKNQYIEHVKAKLKVSAMSGILSAVEKEEALSIFNQLLQENKKFAFNTLGCIRPKYTLSRTLLYQLDPQQKEDYKVHLETKTTAKAKLILKKFYSNNKESSSNLSTENSNEPLVHKRKIDDLNEFLDLQIEGNFFSSAVILDEIVGKYEIDTGTDEISTVEPQAKRQCISVPPFEGFAELHNQFRNIVPEDSTVNSSLTSNENILDSLESELTFLDSQINGGEQLTSLNCASITRVKFLSKCMVPECDGVDLV